MEVSPLACYPDRCMASRSLQYVGSVVLLIVLSSSALSQSGFTPLAGDMSTFNPSTLDFPASEDPIKIGVFWPFSGSAALNGDTAWAAIGWAVHDINSQGGVRVDGVRRKIVLVKGDHQSKPTAAKRVLERLCLEDRVDLIMGTSGSHLSLIAQQVAAKYKTIYLNVAALSDLLMEPPNFNSFCFRTAPTTTTLARALALFYAARPETDFYILCQDYVYGHSFGEAFRRTLHEEKPEARIVGEDYHPLFAKDFAPYLEKVRGFGAQVIVTGDWVPDIDNLIKQSRQLGMQIPIAGPFTDTPSPLHAIGGPSGQGLVVVNAFNLTHPDANRFLALWNQSWQSWSDPPFTSSTFKWPNQSLMGMVTASTYWYFSVLDRVGTRDTAAIIREFEQSEFELFGIQLKMQSANHQATMNMAVSQLIFPNRWYEQAAGWDTAVSIPAEEIWRPETTSPPAQIQADERGCTSPARLPMYLSQALHGLTYGMLLFLVASGLTLIFGMMGVLNIAHASFFMLAAYFAFQVLRVFDNFFVALLLAPLLVAVLGILVQRFLIRRVQAHGLGHLGELLLTLGIALVISELVKTVWGSDSLVVSVPDSLKGTLNLGITEYPIYRLFVVGLSVMILAILAWLLYRTRLGIIVRASVSDAEMVSALGINTPLISTLVFGLGTWMAGVAGVAAAPLLTVYPGMAEQMSLDAFVVVVVGGLGSLGGALLASLVLGEINAYGIQFVPRLAPVLMFVFMALILARRPTGLFGERL